MELMQARAFASEPTLADLSPNHHGDDEDQRVEVDLLGVEGRVQNLALVVMRGRWRYVFREESLDVERHMHHILSSARRKRLSTTPANWCAGQ